MSENLEKLRTSVGDLSAYGDDEVNKALIAKDREQYLFYQGWQAALQRVAASLASSSQEGQGWKPMATAPTDGTKVLAAGERDGVSWRLVVRQLDRWDGWYTDPGKHHVKPTHWMPLPSPPPAAPTKEA